MPQLTFYPLGNADCCLIDLASGEKILCDFADMRDLDDRDDRRIGLARALRDDLNQADRDYLDVVAFTHLDDDHIRHASDFFHLKHASKYQSSERIKIRELWVPAAAIIEDGVEDEAKIIRAEARYRLKEGSGIRVFSRPAQLEAWLSNQGLTLASRRHLITDAGQIVPTFARSVHGVEFFVHSPFAYRTDEGEILDRNTDSLAFQATFIVDDVVTRVLFSADLDHEALSAIVATTKAHGNNERLRWDVVKLPHHCSYLSLGPKKGEEVTEPVPDVAWLYEVQGDKRAKIVSTSWPIPVDGEDVQPPHTQAANYYRQVVDAEDIQGEFLVTMEHPDVASPKPLVIIIDGTKARVKKLGISGAPAILSRSAPRAG